MATMTHSPTRSLAPTPSRWAMASRQVDYSLTVQRRTWKGSVVAGFFTPLLYVAAMGLMLGRYVQVGALDGAPSYLHFLAPGLLAGQAMLLAVGDATVNELAAPYDVTVQAVSKHLKVLEDAGLVSRSREAQRRPVHLEAQVFDLMTKWIERYRRQAEERYRRLDDVLRDMPDVALPQEGTES